MGLSVSETETSSMNGAQYYRLVGDARAFRQAAALIEDEILDMNVRWDTIEPIGGDHGWPSQMVWESLKTASHFNLAIALELWLKCLLHLHGLGANIPRGRKGHFLALLLSLLPEPTAGQCERLFRKASDNHPFQLIAFCSTRTAKAPKPPNNEHLKTLQDLCSYLDRDAQLWNKRYAWEGASKSEWRHYLDKFDALFEFLQETEAAAIALARLKGVVK